jgi:glycosyltransferase involved in cell wall biosynthesis
LRDEVKTILAPIAPERIIWTGFIDDQAALSALYACSDVLALPSDFEPWGVVVTEAAAASLALVCSSNVGAARDLVTDGLNGRVFTAGDAASLEEALLDVTSSSQVDRMKASSPKVLSTWHEKADPVKGLRQALHSSGVLAC